MNNLRNLKETFRKNVTNDNVKNHKYQYFTLSLEDTSFKKPQQRICIRVKVGGHVKISKYKTIFAKGFTPNWTAEVFVITIVKNTAL